MPSRANRLASEPSPYLRQHAANPVDWYPWGEEAFARARAEDKPVLLSIGYASCHWCHVMAHESFEDPHVAAIMNEGFVCVKVDREERPDVDAVYMTAVQAMTGSGGWPLTVALTPDGEPFFGGTYFPPHDQHGLPSFRRVLAGLLAAWRGRRDEVRENAAELRTALERMAAPFTAQDDAGALPDALAAEAIGRLARQEDARHGGFGGAPKFPPHALLRFLLERPEAEALALAERTLDAMAAGGVHDQIGGGFFRYAVDAGWRVPHFEKMLYDNALLLRAYALAHARTGSERHARTARGIAAWARREMALQEGAGEVAFFSSLDADSDGGEGRFYLWTEADLRAALADADARLAARAFGIAAPGAFEGADVPYLATPPEALTDGQSLTADEARGRLPEVRAQMLAAREKRPRPATDDKVLTSWNGLMLAGLAEAGRLLDDDEMVALARANAAFVRARLWQGGRLLHMWKDGEARVEGLLEDYAYLGLGLLALHRTTLDEAPLAWALTLADAVRERFHDEARGGYFSTAADAEPLLVRPKSYLDAATPSENAAAAELVWWAARYRDDDAGLAQAEAALAGMDEALVQAPQAFASSLRLRGLFAEPLRELVIVGQRGQPGTEALVGAWRRVDDPGAVVLMLEDETSELSSLPLAVGRVGPPAAGNEETRPAAYVCQAGACRLPVHDAEALLAALRESGFGGPGGAGAP
ncbi:MAG: thioredoxin domain-containing protein [Trueperaceae bacterium]